jgi:Chaperone of endosialidase
MAYYTIVKSNGTVLTTIPDGTINTTKTTLGLPGRNYAGYGQTLDTNFVHIIENFASNVPPANPLQGQLWYNTNANLLYVCPQDGTTNANSWVVLATAGGNATTTFGSVNVNGNLNANNVIAVNTIQSANGAFTNISVTANANIASSTITTANIGTLNTQIITTGSNTTAGTMNGTWTLAGGLSGNSLIVANGNIYTTGIRTNNYYYANGAPFNPAGTYTNGNVFDYLTGANSVVRFTGNIAPNLIAATGNISTTGNISATGNITGNYIIGNGSLLTGVSVSGITTIVNGNSNVNIPAANGNVTISSAGNANIVVVTGTGANIAGTLSSTGNANVGNLGTTGVFATTLSSTGNANIGGTLNVSGNTTFSGVGQRILGDFSNATLASRTVFQSSTANTATDIPILPNGTAAGGSSLNTFNLSNIANSAYVVMGANSTVTRLYSATTGSATLLPLAFGMGVSEAARIDTGLNFLVGRTSFSSANSGVKGTTFNTLGYISLETDYNTGGSLYINTFGAGSNSTNQIYFYRNNTAAGLIVTNPSNQTSLVASSDYRLKNTITPLTTSGAFIDKLKPSSWIWNSSGVTDAGFIAHEAAEVTPNSVYGEKDAVDKDGNPVYQMMNASSSEIIANMVAELQDLRRRVAQLEAKNP